MFEIRKVLDESSADSEQMVLLHRAKGGGPQLKEMLNVARTPILDHSTVTGARILTDQISGQPQVEVSFTDAGRALFAAVTRANVDKRLAILVEGKVVMAPIIRTEIKDGRALITGDFTQEETRALVDTINKAVGSGDKGKLKPWDYGPYDQLRPKESLPSK